MTPHELDTLYDHIVRVDLETHALEAKNRALRYRYMAGLVVRAFASNDLPSDIFFIVRNVANRYGAVPIGTKSFGRYFH